jgi:hypothetical protein
LSALQTDGDWAEIKYFNCLTVIWTSKEPYMAARAAALRKVIAEV